MISGLAHRLLYTKRCALEQLNWLLLGNDIEVCYRCIISFIFNTNVITCIQEIVYVTETVVE